MPIPSPHGRYCSAISMSNSQPEATDFVKNDDVSKGPPILFIHYGPANYLRWTLAVARRFNPDKQIVLLGEVSNSRSARGVAEFVDFESLSGTEKEQEFQLVFQVIQGERHRFNKTNGVEFWLKFVFRRWFLIEAFLKREGLDSFWTFDSDTLVLADLSAREERFSKVQATAQCKNQCLNGWIGSRELVSRYTQSILDQFSDEAFLEAQMERLKIHAGLSFNEMDAFAEFRSRQSVKTWHGEKPIDGKIFDDALAFSEGFEVAPENVLGKTAIKRLWSDGQNIYARHLESGEFVRLLTCNMSWMPDYMWRRIVALATSCSNGLRVAGCGLRMAKLVEISTREPLIDRFFRKTKLLAWNLRQKYQNHCGHNKSLFQ